MTPSLRAPLAPPPATEGELARAARTLAGRTVADVAARLGIEVPVDLRRAKGFVGALVERALGVEPAPGVAGPDLPALGLELKTIPLDVTGRPRESTFVCTLSLAHLLEETWSTSAVRRKLARVLWVPIEHDPRLTLGARRVGSAFLWSPSEDEEALLEADWERVQDEVARGAIEALDARVGRVLQVRPKAAHGRSRVRARGEHDAPVQVTPRGFYLRAGFTGALVACAMRGC